MKRFHAPLCLFPPLGLLCAGAYLLSGCAEINKQIFSNYAAEIQRERVVMDYVIGHSYEWVRAADAAAYQGDFSPLIITTRNGCRWRAEDRFLYLKIKQTRAIYLELNQGMLDYAALLEKLADNRMESPEIFTSLAERINHNAAAAARGASLNPKKEGLQLFSAAAMETAREYIRNRRVEELGKVVRENQGLVEAYSDHCRELIGILCNIEKEYYAENYIPLQNQWNNGVKADPMLVEKMFGLNDKFTDALNLLKQMDEFYSALPAAHADLAEAVETTRPVAPRPGFQRLAEEGRRLQMLYESARQVRP